MVHQLKFPSFLSLATVGTARSALAKLNLSSGSSDRQTLIDLVGASWQEVLVKMEGKTKPEVVEAAAEYGITLEARHQGGYDSQVRRGLRERLGNSSLGPSLRG